MHLWRRQSSVGLDDITKQFCGKTVTLCESLPFNVAVTLCKSLPFNVVDVVNIR